MRELPKFLILYAATYGAYGVASPFLPAFVSARGLAPEQLGLVLAAGTAARLDAQGFWVMAALCAVALPLTLRLRESAAARR